MKNLLIAAVAVASLSAGSAFAQSRPSDLTVFGLHNVAPAPSLQTQQAEGADQLTVFGFRMPRSHWFFDNGATAPVYASRSPAVRGG